MTNGPYTFTISFAYYYELTPSSAHSLGAALRQQISPTPPPPYVSDTTILMHDIDLFSKLPIALGNNNTWTDTTYDPDGSYEIVTRTLHVNAFGTAKFPDGVTRDVLRWVEEQTRYEYDESNVFQEYVHNKEIVFVASDWTQISFEADSTYSGSGSFLSIGWKYQTKQGNASVNEISNALPEKFALLQNYPNPFNPATTISFDVVQSGFVALRVYDMLGREVATLVNGEMQPGGYSAVFDASHLSSGLYFYRLTSGNNVQTKKMTFIK